MQATKNIKISKAMLKEIEKMAENFDLDSESYLKQIISKGKITLSQAIKELKVDVWEFLDILKKENKNLNVVLEDWKDAVEI